MLTYKFLKNRREEKEKRGERTNSFERGVERGLGTLGSGLGSGLGFIGNGFSTVGSTTNHVIQQGPIHTKVRKDRERREADEKEKKELRRKLEHLSTKVEASEASKEKLESKIQSLTRSQKAIRMESAKTKRERAKKLKQERHRKMELESKIQSLTRNQEAIRMESAKTKRELENERLQRALDIENERNRREKQLEQERYRIQQKLEKENEKRKSEREANVERCKKLQAEQDRLQNEIANHKQAFRVFGEFQAENEESIEQQLEDLKRTQKELKAVHSRLSNVEDQLAKFEKDIDAKLRVAFEQHEEKLKEYIADIVKKLPRPTTMRKKTGILRNTWIVSFECPCGCKESWEFQTRNWKLWCQYGFIMMKTAAITPLSVSPLQSLADGFLELWTAEESNVPTEWIKKPFLSPKQRNELEEHLASTPGIFRCREAEEEHEVLFYDKHFYHPGKGAFLPDTAYHSELKSSIQKFS